MHSSKSLIGLSEPVRTFSHVLSSKYVLVIWVVTIFVSHMSLVVFIGDGNLSRVSEAFPVRIADADNFPG